MKFIYLNCGLKSEDLIVAVRNTTYAVVKIKREIVELTLNNYFVAQTGLWSCRRLSVQA